MGWTRHQTLRYVDLDYLGHVTAAAYLMLFEEARAAWMGETFGIRFPTYVVAHQEIDYLREVLLEDSPLTLSVTPVRVGTSSIGVEETLVTAGGETKARSRATLVMWRREERTPRPLSNQERSALQLQLVGEGDSD